MVEEVLVEDVMRDPKFGNKEYIDKDNEKKKLFFLQEIKRAKLKLFYTNHYRVFHTSDHGDILEWHFKKSCNKQQNFERNNDGKITISRFLNEY